MLPSVVVPHWFTHTLTRALRHHRVEFQLHLAYARRADSDDPDDQMDLLRFPSARAEYVQLLLDAIKPEGCG